VHVKYRNSTLRLVAGSALLVALSAGVCAAQYGKQWERLVADGSYTEGPGIGGLPQKSVPAVEVPRTTYTDMLGKGYARVGEFIYSSEKHGSDERRCKKDMLEMAMLQGADVAWVDTHSYSYEGTELIGSRVRTKTIKVVWGSVTYFVHNPELAAKQLGAGRKKWEMRAVEIPAKRAILIAKLETVVIKLSAMDASWWVNPGERERYLSGIRTAQDEVKFGENLMRSPWPKRFEEIQFDKKTYPGLSTLATLQWAFHDIDTRTESAQLSELHRAVMEAWGYLAGNWDIIADNKTLNSPDHFYPY